MCQLNLNHMPLLRLLVIFLGFSYIISSAAVPTTRSLKSGFEDPTVQHFVAQDAKDSMKFEEAFEMVEEMSKFEGRMDLENTDYPGTGANNHHDPRSPGKA